MTAVIYQFNLPGMAKPGRRISTPREFRNEFIDRTKAARVKKFATYEDIAFALSRQVGRAIAPDTYRKWEKQGKGGALMPHDLIIPFCELTETDPWELLTGLPFSMGNYMASIRRQAEGQILKFSRR